MTTQINSFSPDLLNNFSKLHEFVSGENEIQTIKQEKIPPSQRLYFGRWKVVWITIKFPFEYILSCFFTVIAYLLKCLSFKGTSHFFTVLSKHMLRDQVHLEALTRHKERLLVPSANVHKLLDWDYYGWSKKPLDFIVDPDVRETTTLEYLRSHNMPIDNPKVNWIKFHHSKGLCRGAAFWFLSLYVKSEGLFPSEKERIIAVARQFENGIPRQAALLQTLNYVENKLLHLNSSPDIPLNRYVSIEKENPSESLEKIHNLPPGAYCVGLTNHALAYVKCNQHIGYLWDPSMGAIDLGGPDQSKLLYDLLLQSDSITKFISFQEVNRSSPIC